MKAKKLKWMAEDTPAANARAVLPGLVEAFFEAGRVAAAARATPEQLHGFRLATKRFRYTLEIFRPIYGPGLDKKLDQLRKVQQRLGEINDCAASAVLVAGGEAARTPEARRLLALLKTRLRERKAEFHRYWRETFNSPSAREQWIGYLSRYAGRTGQKPARRPAEKAAAPEPEAAPPPPPVPEPAPEPES